MYKIQIQFIPGYDNIWVFQINPEDNIWEFETEAEAISKVEELKSLDSSGRDYKVFYPSTQENTI